jgi:hypothetical protein
MHIMLSQPGGVPVARALQAGGAPVERAQSHTGQQLAFDPPWGPPCRRGDEGYPPAHTGGGKAAHDKTLLKNSQGKTLTEKREYMRGYMRKRRQDPNVRAAESAYMREYMRRKRRPTQRATLLRALGDCCARCGFTDARALQIDHVDGGGTRERRHLSRSRYYTRVLESVSKGGGRYQLLCANCNWIKRAERDGNPGAGARAIESFLR